MPLGSGFPLGLGGTRSRLGLVQGISGGFLEEVMVATFSQRAATSFEELKVGLSPRVCVPGLVQGTLAVSYLLGWFLSFFLHQTRSVERDWQAQRCPRGSARPAW